MNKELTFMMRATLICVCALTFAVCAAGAADSFKMSAQVIAVQPDAGTLIVSTFPDSGKRWELKVEAKTAVLIDREIPFSRLPLYQTVGLVGYFVSPKDAQPIFVVDEVRVFSAGDPAARLPKPYRKLLFGKLRKENGGVVLERDSDTIKLQWGKDGDTRPIIWSLSQGGSLRDLKPAVVGEVTVTSGDRVEAMRFKVQHEPYGSYSSFDEPGEPVPVVQIRSDVERILGAHAGVTAEVDRLAPVRMNVSPALVHVGEQPVLEMAVLSDRKPNTSLEIYPRFLETDRGQRAALEIEWQRGTDPAGRTVFLAAVSLQAGELGNYLIHWKCDIGGDIADYWRNYAVIDDKSIVVLLNDCYRDDETDRKWLTAKKIPHTYWTREEMEFRDLVAGKDAKWFADWSRPAREFGIEPQLFLFKAQWNSTRVGDPLNFNRDDEVYIREVLRAYKQIWPLYRFPQECLNAGTYAFSTAFTEALRKEGFTSMVSITPGHLLEHQPGQMINTTSMSAFPHFISTDDFRKTGNETGGNVVAISQFSNHLLRMRQGGEASSIFEPFWASDERHSFGGRDAKDPRKLDEIFFSRTLDLADMLLRNSVNNPGRPYFIIAGLEFAYTTGERSRTSTAWGDEGDQLLLEFLLKKIDEYPIVFTTGNAIAAYLHRHCKESPLAVNYYHDYHAGASVDGSPLLVPDSIEVEHPGFKAILTRPNLLPEFHWDFSKSWEYKGFGNGNLIRPHWRGQRDKVAPNLVWKYDIEPHIEDWRSLSIKRRDTVEGHTFVVEIAIQSPRKVTKLPVGIWDVPRAFMSGKKWFVVESGNAEFLPVRAPQTGNLNGVLIAGLEKGANTIRLRINSPARQPASMDIEFGGKVRGKTWTRDDQTMTYLWPINPWGTRIVLNLPEGKSTTVYLTPEGNAQPLAPGRHEFCLSFNNWMRVVGLSREEILRFVKAD